MNRRLPAGLIAAAAVLAAVVVDAAARRGRAGTDELDQLSRSRHSRCGISWPGLACAQRLARAGMDVLIQPAVRMKPLTTFWHTARSRRPASGCCISTPTSGVRW